jgi:hypothetical protein
MPLRQQSASAKISPTVSAWKLARASTSGAAAIAEFTICPTARSGRRSTTSSRQRRLSTAPRPGWTASRSSHCSTRRHGHPLPLTPNRMLQIPSSRRRSAARPPHTVWAHEPIAMNWESLSLCAETTRWISDGVVSIPAQIALAANTTAMHSVLTICFASENGRSPPSKPILR